MWCLSYVKDSKGPEYFDLVGSAHVHGLMDGSAVLKTSLADVRKIHIIEMDFKMVQGHGLLDSRELDRMRSDQQRH